MPTGGQTVELVEQARLPHGHTADGQVLVFERCCSVQPAGSSLDADGRHLVTSQWELYAPPTFPTSGDWLVLALGMRLRVDGQLQLHHDLDGTPTHVRGLLKRWEG